MDELERRELFGIVAVDLDDAFSEVLGKAEDLMVIADDNSRLLEDAAKLFRQIGERWAQKTMKASVPG
jgi:hypothetical protein